VLILTTDGFNLFTSSDKEVRSRASAFPPVMIEGKIMRNSAVNAGRAVFNNLAIFSSLQIKKYDIVRTV
jgi:hypothetical protein